MQEASKCLFSNVEVIIYISRAEKTQLGFSYSQFLHSFAGLYSILIKRRHH